MKTASANAIKESLTKKEAVVLAQFLERLDIGIEPDPRLETVIPGLHAPVVLFRLKQQWPRTVSDLYAAAATALSLSAGEQCPLAHDSHRDERLVFRRLHYVFRQRCGVPANGVTITTWADRSGNADTATKATGTCTFNTSQINSQPAVTFSNCGLTLATGIGPGSGRWTIFAVYRRSDTTTYGKLLACASTTCVSYYTGNDGSGQNRQQGFDSNDFLGIAYGTTTVSTSWHQTNVAFQNSSSGNTIAFRLDRATDGSTLINSTNITSATTSVGYNAHGSAQFFAGQLAELIYYNSLLSNADITSVETYLHAKYGL